MEFSRLSQALSFSLVAIATQVSGQTSFTYPGCEAVTSANFELVSLVNKTKDNSLAEPVRFAVAKNGEVYFAERGGAIKVVKTDGSITKIGAISVFPIGSPLKKDQSGSDEMGLTGLTLDPNFETNHFLYVTYQPPSPDVMKVSRFTVNSNNLDLGSEKVLMSFDYHKNYCCHTGGDLKFDASGNLLISVGNNTRNPPDPSDAKAYVDESFAGGDANDQAHAANTNDYRGKILRIKPTPEGSYTVPPGNFKDFYASQYTADELTKIKPEIYGMGMRNPYTIDIDPLKGSLTWGDVGPDEGLLSEEYNLTQKPGFFGWPYFAGSAGYAKYSYRLSKDANAPMNTSTQNTGVQKLPAAIGATVGYQQAAAIAGPVYRYSFYPNSTKKLPPHFDGKWFVGDWKLGWLHVISLDNETSSKKTEEKSLQTLPGSLLQVSIGPDGLLYTLEYASANTYWVTDNRTRIARWEYKGAACTGPTALENRKANQRLAAHTTLLSLGANGHHALSLPAEAKGLKLYDLQGKLLWSHAVDATASRRIEIPSMQGSGLYRVQFSY